MRVRPGVDRVDMPFLALTSFATDRVRPGADRVRQ